MQRHTFLQGSLALITVAAVPSPSLPEDRLVAAARSQIGITTGYDPSYIRIQYPNGDVPRSTGVCADVIVRAYRDAFGLDLQKLVHEDREKDGLAYFRLVGTGPDTNIDHRRVINLEIFLKRQGFCLSWATSPTPGDQFSTRLHPGDLLTWMLDGGHPHIAIVSDTAPGRTSVVHNIGRGAEEVPLAIFSDQLARGHFRWLPS